MELHLDLYPSRYIERIPLQTSPRYLWNKAPFLTTISVEFPRCNFIAMRKMAYFDSCEVHKGGRHLEYGPEVNEMGNFIHSNRNSFSWHIAGKWNSPDKLFAVRNGILAISKTLARSLPLNSHLTVQILAIPLLRQGRVVLFRHNAVTKFTSTLNRYETNPRYVNWLYTRDWYNCCCGITKFYYHQHLL